MVIEVEAVASRRLLHVRYWHTQTGFGQRSVSAVDVRYGSWSCENALAEALTSRDFGEVAVFGHLAECGGFSVWKCS
jgi:hypothetical protein